MTKILNLKIKNFRGIRNFEQDFNQDFICLIGRGDTGKTTIIEAISYVLSPSWNLTFHDTDFYNCKITENIEIEAIITNFPKELQTENKLGLHIRAYNKTTKKIEEISSEDTIQTLTIKLIVDKYLEPKWYVIPYNQTEVLISANDRSKLNCFMISDYIDKHFSWNKGSPLYSLLKDADTENDKNIVIDALRSAKQKIDSEKFETLTETTELIKNNIFSLGYRVSDIKTSIDFKDIVMKDGKICLHDSNIPLRLKGKGSKRLISIAIQLALTKYAGIVLIDEIEQGLEPDRIKQIIRSIKELSNGQVFITTHSRDAIVELSIDNLFLLQFKDDIDIIATKLPETTNLQGVIRACPEAFFAKKIILCEGSTEIGICRALDNYRKKINKELMAYKDCYYINAEGSKFFDRAKEINPFFEKTCILMDSDVPTDVDKKEEVKRLGIEIFDCENTNNIEKQIFKDLPWATINKIIDYVIRSKNISEQQITDSIKSKYTACPTDWRAKDCLEIRKALNEVATIDTKEWFKRIDHGEFLGNTIFENFNEINETHLGKMLKNLIDWID